MQTRLDETEAAALKGGKRMLTKLDQRVHDLEVELADECRRHAETLKNYRNRERKVRELQFQVDEDKKSSERMYNLIEKMQTKIKTYKRQLEEAVSIGLSFIFEIVNMPKSTLNLLRIHLHIVIILFEILSSDRYSRKISFASDISPS